MVGFKIHRQNVHQSVEVLDVVFPGSGAKLLDDGDDQRQRFVRLKTFLQIHFAHFPHGVGFEQRLRALFERHDEVQTLVGLVDQHEAVLVRFVLVVVPFAEHDVQEHVDVLYEFRMGGHLLDAAQRRQNAHRHGLVDERRAAGRHLVAEQQAFDELELDGVEQGQFGAGVTFLRLHRLGDHEQGGEFFGVRFRTLYDAHAFLDGFQNLLAHFVERLRGITEKQNENLYKKI